MATTDPPQSDPSSFDPSQSDPRGSKPLMMSEPAPAGPSAVELPVLKPAQSDPAETTAAESMQSALLVVVAEAEAAVGVHRVLLDGAAVKGVPAHITVLYPFVPPELIDGAVLAAVRDTVSGVPRFDAELVRVAWFGEQVVYVEPAPGQRFRELTVALWRRFPDWPPYRGVFADVVPHLTIGHDVAREVLAGAAAEVEAHLPIRFRVEGVRLMAGSGAPGSWRTVAEFALG